MNEIKLLIIYVFPTQVTYRYYDTFHMQHHNLSLFDAEQEKDFLWRQINNQELKTLEKQMLVRNKKYYLIEHVFILTL